VRWYRWLLPVKLGQLKKVLILKGDKGRGAKKRFDVSEEDSLHNSKPMVC
jgi:hypothetical protein